MERLATDKHSQCDHRVGPGLVPGKDARDRLGDLEGTRHAEHPDVLWFSAVFLQAAQRAGQQQFPKRRMVVTHDDCQPEV